MERIKLLKVDSLPKVLEEGLLYVSEEFGIAGHLCPCGCKSKIITPIDPTEWSFSEMNNEPTLRPSIGNWQLPCKSHYWIINGLVEWSYEWDEKRIEEGREEEGRVRQSYYSLLNNKPSRFERFINWMLKK